MFGVVQEVLVYLKISTHFKSLGKSPKKKGSGFPSLLWRLVYNGIALLQRVCMDYGFPRAMDLDFTSRCVWSLQ